MNTRTNHRISPNSATTRERSEEAQDVEGSEIGGFIEISAMSLTILDLGYKAQ